MKDKKCDKCGQYKPLSSFRKDEEVCKRCRFKDKMASRRIANLHKIYLYLIEHPCVDCGENDPVVLEFDHIRDKKAFTIGSCLHYDWSKIENEIAKCEIRCSNCHKRKTAREQNWGILRFCKTSP